MRVICPCHWAIYMYKIVLFLNVFFWNCLSNFLQILNMPSVESVLRIHSNGSAQLNKMAACNIISETNQHLWRYVTYVSVLVTLLLLISFYSIKHAILLSFVLIWIRHYIGDEDKKGPEIRWGKDDSKEIISARTQKATRISKEVK